MGGGVNFPGIFIVTYCTSGVHYRLAKNLETTSWRFALQLV
jgi:hypothetical protein